MKLSAILAMPMVVMGHMGISNPVPWDKSAGDQYRNPNPGSMCHGQKGGGTPLSGTVTLKISNGAAHGGGPCAVFYCPKVPASIGKCTRNVVHTPAGCTKVVSTASCTTKGRMDPFEATESTGIYLWYWNPGFNSGTCEIYQNCFTAAGTGGGGGGGGEPPTPAAPTPASNGGCKIYTVQAGDWLAKIAEEQGTTFEQILRDNPQVSDPEAIDIGDELKINCVAGPAPTPKAGAPTAAKAPTPKPTPKAAPTPKPVAQGCTDKIKNGDETFVDCGGSCPKCTTFRWWPTEWSKCSKSCGGGTQTRDVGCKDKNLNNAAVKECERTLGHEAITSQQCNIEPCGEYKWVAKGFSKCNTDCGDGFQSRVVRCEVSGVKVANALCTGPRPETEQACTLASKPVCDVGAGGHWAWNAWDTCNAQCTGPLAGTVVTGVQSRDVWCSEAGVMKEPADCSGDMPAVTQDCTTECQLFTWATCSWDECTATCGGSGGQMSGLQSRQVFCMNKGMNVDLSLCDPATRPASMEAGCNPQACTASNWMTTTWSACNGGSRMRGAHCHLADGANALEGDCAAIAKPVLIQACTPRYPEVCGLGVVEPGPEITSAAGMATSSILVAVVGATVTLL